MIACLTGFLMGFIGSMPIAGPVSLLVFHRGLMGRYWEGWMIGIGGAVAEGVYSAIALHGMGTMHASIPFPEAFTTAMRSLILAALGLYFILYRRDVHHGNPLPDLSTYRWTRALLTGFSAAALNASLFFTWLAAVTMLYPLASAGVHPHHTVSFGVGVIAGIITWFTIFLGLLDRLRDRVQLTAVQRLIRCVGVGLLAGSVISVGSMGLR